MSTNVSAKAFLSKFMQMASRHLMMVVFLLGITHAKAQNILHQKISIQVDDMSLKRVLNQIGSEADVKFVYSSSHIALDKKVTASASQEELGKVLNKLFHRTEIGFEVSDRFIILKDNHEAIRTEAPLADSLIKGKVLSETNEPFPGATILEKGTGNGATSGADGSN